MNRITITLTVAVCFLLSTSTAIWAKSYPKSLKVDESIFDFKEKPFQVNLSPYPERQVEYFPVKAQKVTFPSPVKTKVKRNNTVHGILFEPTHMKTDVGVILLPWWKDRDTSKIGPIGSSLAAAGIRVLFLAQAYQFERAPKGVGSGNWTVSAKNPERSFKAIVQSVKDVRRAATWLLKKRGVHKDKLGIMGISLGGFVAALSYGVDDRFKAATILLAGGNFPAMLDFHSWNPEVQTYMKKYQKHMKPILAGLYKVDPVNYADPKRGKGILLINGLFDPIVPHRCGEHLRKAYRGKMITLPCGHYTALAFLPYILGRTIIHFKARLK